MSSINPECNKLKKEYDECFNSWYVDSFLKGKKSNKCDELFKEYRACIMVYIYIYIIFIFFN